MGTNTYNGKNTGTDESWMAQESTAVWEQLLRLAEGGDIRAIKLYYDMLEKKQRPGAAGTTPDMEPMAAIRRAVFGDAAVDAAAGAAAGAVGAGKMTGGVELPTTAMGSQALPDAELDDDW